MVTVHSSRVLSFFVSDRTLITQDCNATFKLLCGCEGHIDKDISLRDFIRCVIIRLVCCVASKCTGCIHWDGREACCFTPAAAATFVSHHFTLTISTAAHHLHYLLSLFSLSFSPLSPCPVGWPLAPVPPKAPESCGGSDFTWWQCCQCN